MTKKSTIIQRIMIACFLMLASQIVLAQNICDCDGNSHTPGVLTWLGDTFADDGTYTWEGQTVNFNCATWGYDCGDIAGAPADDPYAVCSGSLPPNNGCAPDAIFGCNDPLALNYDVFATVNDGSCIYPEGCTDPTANNYDPIAIVDNGTCTYDLICDCAGTQHTAGVLTWIGDTFADDGTYTWNGQPVDFNCATWGYDCGDIAGAPLDDPYAVCAGNLPPNNGCIAAVFGCTDPAANNYNPAATADDGSCMYDIAGCTDPLANNYDPMANIEDGSCTYGTCANFMLDAVQTACGWDDATQAYYPGVNLTFQFDGGCTVANLFINLAGTEYPFVVDAPFNVSGSIFPLIGFPENAVFSAYYVLTDGTASDVFDFQLGDCSQDPLICDCAGTAHTIGVTSWLGDTFADNGAYTWGNQPVDFNCATWGYDCGDVVGAPAEDPYGICAGNLPPNNGCGANDVFGCTDPLANNYNVDATVNDGSCTYDVFGCTDPLANNYNMDATIDDGSCSYGLCENLAITATQTLCQPDANDVLLPGMDFTVTFDGTCTAQTLVLVLGGVEYPFNFTAPDNVSGSVFSLIGFPENTTFSAYFTLSDGSASLEYEFATTSCSQDPLICDCAGTAHTIGVLSWIGDTFADNSAYTWGGQLVDFNCATWGYDCGDIVGAPAEDTYGVCLGNLPPNNGCALDVVFGCTDATATNYNPNATTDDGSCIFEILGCTDPAANNYNMDANVDDGSCTFGACSNLVLNAVQTPCTPDANDVLNPSVDFTFTFDGGCTVDSVVVVLDGIEYPFVVDAPENVSGSVFGLVGFPANIAYSAFFILTDGTESPLFDFATGDCTQDALICDCAGTAHTIGVLSWLGDTYADNAAYNWAGQPVDFNCATWGYDCGDIAGAPAEDPYGVCAGNLPPNNGCAANDVFGCTDPMANNYNPAATVNDGSCTYDILGCMDPLANNYNPAANVDDGSCTYGACSNLVLTAEQTPCTQDANGVLNPGVEFTFTLDGGCLVDSIVVVLDGTAYPFAVTAPDNVSGSTFPLEGFPANSAFTAYYVLVDGTVSDVFDFTVGDCSQDAIICDCDGNQHTIGVLSWIGDTFADNGAYTWGGVTVNFNCATWGYDCGDIAGAPAEDPYGVCAGNLPPSNGCITNVVDVATAMNIEAYPNPTSGMITLVNRGEGGNKQIRVFDQTGKLQFAEQRAMAAGSSELFNLSALAAGTYQVQVVGNSGVSNITVIVQK